MLKSHSIWFSAPVQVTLQRNADFVNDWSLCVSVCRSVPLCASLCLWCNADRPSAPGGGHRRTQGLANDQCTIDNCELTLHIQLTVVNNVIICALVINDVIICAQMITLLTTVSCMQRAASCVLATRVTLRCVGHSQSQPVRTQSIGLAVATAGPAHPACLPAAPLLAQWSFRSLWRIAATLCGNRWAERLMRTSS